MNQRFPVAAAVLLALVALAGCGSSNPGSAPFETNTQGVALGTNGYLWLTRNGGTSWSRVAV